MKIIKWLVFVCILGVSINVASGQSTPLSPGGEARVICTSLKHGAPAANLEWEAQQLVAAEGIYTLTGKSPVPFTSLTVGWLVSDLSADPKSFEVAIRTRKDEAPWTEWVYFPGDIRPGESPSGLFWTYLYIPIDSGVHTDYEVRIRPPAGMPLDFVRVGVVDNSVAPEATGITAPLKEPDASTALGVTAVTPSYPIISRLTWLGAEHPWSVSEITITHAIIHHTVQRNHTDTPDLYESIQDMRDIRSWHIGRGWADIGYNFVIDRAGRIFQGTYNPNLSARDVRGIHAGFANSRSVGIALIGQFCPNWPDPKPGSPSDEALRSLERLLAWRFHQRSLDSRGSAVIPVTIRYGENPDGSERNRSEDRVIPRITGHRDVDRTTWDAIRNITIPEVADTACPGNNLQNLLPTIRANVRRPRLHVSPAAISASLLVGSGWTTIGTVRVTNPGWGTLSWSATDNRTWLRVTPVSGTTTTETDSVTVQATTSGLGFGRHTGTITFAGADPAIGSTGTVAVTLTIPTRPLGLQPEGVEEPQ